MNPVTHWQMEYDPARRYYEITVYLRDGSAHKQLVTEEATRGTRRVEFVVHALRLGRLQFTWDLQMGALHCVHDGGVHTCDRSFPSYSRPTSPNNYFTEPRNTAQRLYGTWDADGLSVTRTEPAPKKKTNKWGRKLPDWF